MLRFLTSARRHEIRALSTESLIPWWGPVDGNGCVSDRPGRLQNLEEISLDHNDISVNHKKISEAAINWDFCGSEGREHWPAATGLLLMIIEPRMDKRYRLLKWPTDMEGTRPGGWRRVERRRCLCRLSLRCDTYPWLQVCQLFTSIAG